MFHVIREKDSIENKIKKKLQLFDMNRVWVLLIHSSELKVNLSKCYNRFCSKWCQFILLWCLNAYLRLKFWDFIWMFMQFVDDNQHWKNGQREFLMSCGHEFLYFDFWCIFKRIGKYWRCWNFVNMLIRNWQKEPWNWAQILTNSEFHIKPKAKK